MAARVKADYLGVLQDTVALLDDTRTWLSGSFQPLLDAAATSISAGDDEPPDPAMQAAISSVWAAAEQFHLSIRSLIRSTHPLLGDYAGASSTASAVESLAAFHDKLTDDSEAIESRGLTKFTSLTADGSNTGNGRMPVLNTDPQSLEMDLSHIETIQLRCLTDEFGGATRGSEVFVATGGELPKRPWLDGGSSKSNGTLSLLM